MKSSNIWRTAPAMALLFVSSIALAASPADDAKTPRRAARGPDVRTASIALQTDGSDEIDAPALRAALTSALGGIAVTERGAEKTTELATVVVRRKSGGNVTVVFRGPDGREVERHLDLPKNRALATETIALAAGNLVRDEAAELVAALTPPEPIAAETAPAPDEKSPTPPLPAPARRISCNDGESIFFGGDFVPSVGTSFKYPEHRRTLSLNFVAGYSRGLNGFELGVGANIESAFMCGVQIAAGANIVLGDARGLQLAIINAAMGTVEGAQVGVVNVNKGDVEGAQIGVVSFASGSLHGVQSSTVNVLGGAFSGAQTGVVNVAGGEISGAQTGVVNMAGSAISGAQVGVVNLAGGHVDGAQVGTVNFTPGDVSGTQIGVVNYADKSDYPIGVVSVVRHGQTSVDGWATEAGMGMVGVRHGGRVIHNIYGVGARIGSPSAWSLALGLGVRAQLATALHVDFQAISYWLQKSTPFAQDAQIASFGVSFGYALSPTFGVFAAPTYNVLVTTEKDLAEVKPPWGSTSLYEDSAVSVHAWPGATLGVRASL